MESTPAFLSALFPETETWSSLKRCSLKVDEGTAGLDLEITEFGYQVESIDAQPGQDFEAGDIIIAIDGHPLLALQESELEETFGHHFKAGAELVLVSSKEISEAKEKKEDQDMEPPPSDANYELLWRVQSETEREATVRIPVGRATAWLLDEGTAANIHHDLSIVSEKFSLNARPLISDKGMESIILTGLPSAIAQARPEVVDLLNYYRDRDGKRKREDVDASAMTDEVSAVASALDASTVKKMELPAHVKDIRQFQYHDHTADIIVHSWGTSLAEAFAQVCVGMFNYMSPLEKVELVRSVEVQATGHDLLDLLYHLLDEFLYMFATEMLICRCIEILSFDQEKFSIRARGYGEKMDLKKHEQGTEIKAITMHMMKILDPTSMLTEDGKSERQEAAEAEFPYEVYVLLDI